MVMATRIIVNSTYVAGRDEGNFFSIAVQLRIIPVGPLINTYTICNFAFAFTAFYIGFTSHH
jgi:hypothetical protein